ncbi:apoptosis facilitator Bcl-2-like protein 14 isoform X1 [Polypterus senegalus]|uniref:apoptosis facilitator Bcl-2-like protein 14 isoform X1 n=1 Tax=Polypterus senegalus TaxID=55291 RepID=UPI00196271B5|nr:apoptosis facilitator Bcl-2-like protein 14 isoform X1 [Polypterus senegalus]
MLRMCPTSATEMENSSPSDSIYETYEFKMLMVYVQRRRPTLDSPDGKKIEQADAAGEENKQKGSAKKQKKWKGWKKLLPKCVTSPDVVVGHEEDAIANRMLQKEDNSEKVAEKLGEILNSNDHFKNLSLSLESLETDGNEDEEQDVIQKVVNLIRESGDQLNERIKEDKRIEQCLTETFTYSLFKNVLDLFFKQSMNVKDEVKIAYTAELTTKFCAIDHHPMNMVLGFGAKYLQDNFSQWIQSHGGWEKGLQITDEEEVE